MVNLQANMQTFTNTAGTSKRSSESTLNYTVKSWVGIALIGQWMFAIYVFSIYALPSLLGNPELTLICFTDNRRWAN